MNPIGFLICGPSGVGKTSHFKEMLTNAGVKQDVTLFDPDSRKESEHTVRSEMALQAVKDAIEKGISFGYTATCGGNRVVDDLIQRMQMNKYRIVVCIVYVSLPVALERIRKRTHQFVPDEVVADLHSFFKSKAERFMKLPVEIYLYNNETDFNLLYSRNNKKIVCRNEGSDFYFDVSRYCSSSI
jgi:predicted ABC-type ATPase